MLFNMDKDESSSLKSAFRFLTLFLAFIMYNEVILTLCGVKRNKRHSNFFKMSYVNSVLPTELFVCLPVKVRRKTRFVFSADNLVLLSFLKRSFQSQLNLRHDCKIQWLDLAEAKSLIYAYTLKIS